MPFITNGDFSDAIPLAGWTATGAVVGEPTGAFAQLQTDGVFDRTLEQGFLMPNAASMLSFDFAFSTTATQPPAPGVFPDSFTASLEASAGGALLDILVVDLDGAVPDPSDGEEDLIGALPIDVVLDPSVSIDGFVPFSSGTMYHGRISLALPAPLWGAQVTLYFDLFDEADQADSIAAVDNVAVTLAAVPVPGSLGLLALGLIALAAAAPARGIGRSLRRRRFEQRARP